MHVGEILASSSLLHARGLMRRRIYVTSKVTFPVRNVLLRDELTFVGTWIGRCSSRGVT